MTQKIRNHEAETDDARQTSTQFYAPRNHQSLQPRTDTTQHAPLRGL